MLTYRILFFILSQCFLPHSESAVGPFFLNNWRCKSVFSSDKQFFCFSKTMRHVNKERLFKCSGHNEIIHHWLPSLRRYNIAQYRIHDVSESVFRSFFCRFLFFLYNLPLFFSKVGWAFFHDFNWVAFMESQTA